MFQFIRTNNKPVVTRGLREIKHLFIEIYLSIGLIYFFFGPYVTKFYTKFNEIYVQKESLEYPIIFFKHFFNYFQLYLLFIIDFYYFWLNLIVDLSYFFDTEVDEKLNLYFILKIFKNKNVLNSFFIIILYFFLQKKIYKSFFLKKKLWALNRLELRFDPVYFEFVYFFIYDNAFYYIQFYKCYLIYQQNYFKYKYRYFFNDYYKCSLNFYFKFQKKFINSCNINYNYIFDINYQFYLSRGQHTVKQNSVLGQRVRAVRFFNNYKSLNFFQHVLVKNDINKFINL